MNELMRKINISEKWEYIRIIIIYHRIISDGNPGLIRFMRGIYLWVTS